MSDEKIKQKAFKRGFGSPETRGALFIGAVILCLLVGGGFAAYSFLEPETKVEVATGGVDASNVKVKADAKTSEAYKQAKRQENKDLYERAKSAPGGIALPFTFDEEPKGGEDGKDINNCGCTINDDQLMAAIKRLGIGGVDTAAHDNMRVEKSDIYISMSGQLMGEDSKPLKFRGAPIFMQDSGQLLDEKGIAILSKDKEPLYLGKKGEIIDRQTRSVPMHGDLLMDDGGVIIADGRLAIRSGNMQRVGRSDIYLTKEGQLVTMDGKPIRHSGAFVYKDDEHKLINRAGMDVAWEQQTVYQNNSGQLVNVSGKTFNQPGVLFSYEGILIDNNGMLTRPLVNIVKIGASDIYTTKSGSLVDGYGLPIMHYGSKVRIGPGQKLLTTSGQAVSSRSGAEVYLTDKGALSVDVGKGGVQSGVLKISDGVALDRRGQLITRRGRLERRGKSDIYLTGDGLLSDKDGKPIFFNGKDTFIDFTAMLTDGSQGLETYDRIKITDKGGNRVYLTLEGRIVDASGNTIEDVGILSSSDGVLLTSSGKKVIQKSAMERVVTKDGLPVTYQGGEVFKGEDGRLYDADGNLILTPDGRAVYMDESGNLIDETGRIVEDVEFMAGERPVQNGELSTRTKLTTASGERILHEGKEVFVDSSGRLIDQNGAAIVTKDGREVFVDSKGNLVDVNGNRIDDGLLKTESGKNVSTGLVAGREQVVTKTGKSVKYMGKDVFKGRDGALYDENGNAITTKDGQRVFIDSNGNLVDESGNIVTEDLLTVAGERYAKSGDLKTRKRLTDSNGNAVKFDSKDVFISDDGRLVDEYGNAIKTKDGRDVYVDNNGNLVDTNGNLVSEDLLYTVEKNPLDNSGGIKSAKQLTANDGSQLSVDGKAVFVDESGHVVDENGRLVKTKDGREVFVDAHGNLVDKDGNQINEDLLEKVKHRRVSPGEVSSLHQVTDSKGNAVFYNGKEVFTDSTGRLVDENGNAIRTTDGRDVFVDTNGKIVDKDGELIKEPILKDISGETVSSDLKKGRDKLVTKDGKSIKYKGKDVYKSADGSLVSKDGKPILTVDGKKVFVNEKGELVDENGNLVTEDTFSVEERSFVKEGLKSGAEKIITKDGENILFEGKNVFKAKDGSLVDAQGNQILTKGGKKIYVDDQGRLVDENGNQVGDPRFETSTNRPINSGLNAGLEQVTTKDGKSVKYKGENVYKNPDGSLVDENGKSITTSDGRKVYMNEDGQLVDINGNIISEDLLTADSEPVYSGDLTSIPTSEMKQVGESDIYVTRDGTLLDKNGKALTYNGKKIKVGKNGQLFDENGNPIADKSGRPVFINSRGELVDNNGKKIEDTILADGDGVLIDAQGKSAVTSISRVGDSDIFKTKDGRLVDQSGKAIKYNGENVYVGDDGRLYYENGKPVTDKKGNSVYLDSATGKLIDRNGMPVKGSVLTNSEGTLIDANGELITSGGKLKRIAGTDMYRTEDGQVVDGSGKPVKVDGDTVYVDDSGKIVDKYGKPIRFKGQEIYISEDGSVVNRNGQSVLDSENRAVVLSADGGLVNEDGKSVNNRNGKLGARNGSSPGFKKTVKPEDENDKAAKRPKQEATTVPRNDVTPQTPNIGKKPNASSDGNAPIRLDQASADRLQRRYTMIKTAMRNQLMKAQQSADREVGLGFVAVGGSATSGVGTEDDGKKEGEKKKTDGSDGGDANNDKSGTVYRKAGTMLYAVTAYQINSDYIKEIVVDIVGLPPKHPLYKSKAMGKFELAYDRMVLSFDKICPANSECVVMKGVALDPGTSAAALASDVDQHYWYRYGGLFISSLLEGTAEAMSESGTREETTSPTGTRVTTSGLEGDKLILRSFGKVGERFSEAFADNINRPPTAWIDPGEEMAIMLFDDIKGSDK